MQTCFEVRTVFLALTLLSTGLGVAAEGPATGESGNAPTFQAGAPAVANAAGAAEQAFAEALSKNTIAAFEAFLTAHPDSREVPEARERIAWLREDADYTKARAADDEEGYRAFLRDHPGAVFREEVELRIKAIVDWKAQEQAKQRVSAEAAERRSELFKEASKLDTAAAYRLFLAAYPEGPEAQEAQRKLKDAEADDAAFAQAQTSEEGLRAYLAERPEGHNAADARSRLEALKVASAAASAPAVSSPSVAAFVEAKEKRTAAALEEFLAKYPDSTEAAEAREQLGWLREDVAYEKARSADTEEGYRSFLREHPNAVLRDEVQLRLNAIVDRKSRDQAAQQAQAEAEKRRREAYAAAEKLNTATAYGVFLAAYPDAPEGVEANRRMEAAQADDAAFAQAVQTEEDLRTYLATRPEGAHAAEARERLEAAKKAGPVAPPASALGFAEAQRAGTIQALESFLVAFPDSPEATEARSRIDRLREDAAYEKARAANDEDGYRAFLREHPRAALRGEVELRLNALEDSKARAAADARARAEAEQRRREAHEAAIKLDTAVGYAFFLAAYPDAPEAPEIQRRLEAARADDSAYAAAEGSEEGLKGYLAARPKGLHAKQAREGLLAIQNAASEGAFKEAVRIDTVAALESFLKAHPDSPRAPEARAALERRRKTSEPSGPPPGDATLPVLVASFVSAPPVSNGRADDRAWQSAQGLELPLSGGRGPRSIRLKAVHDGTNAYFLAQWSDSTRDTANRPWVWNAERRTYLQEKDRLDDGLLLLLFRGKVAAESFLRQPQGLEADAWLWRANVSEVSGLAEDGWQQMGAERFPKARAYPNPGGGRMWARYEPDAGSPAWNFYMPSGQQGPQVSSYRRAKTAGSRADVTAGGAWSAGVWTVEFARALDTRHTDDVALRVGGECNLAVGVFDRAEEAPDVISGIVRLELRGR
ncbi:MAG: hypothetical protein HZB55_22680 [Deltaproteobacteria bacterium]|nr:hypothetical protein [Deltaproteobacteria bacterium]